MSSISPKISFNQRQNLSRLNIIFKILFKTSHVTLLCWDIMCLPPDEIIQITEVLRESIQLEIKYSIASKNLKVHSRSIQNHIVTPKNRIFPKAYNQCLYSFMYQFILPSIHPLHSSFLLHEFITTSLFSPTHSSVRPSLSSPHYLNLPICHLSAHFAAQCFLHPSLSKILIIHPYIQSFIRPSSSYLYSSRTGFLGPRDKRIYLVLRGFIGSNAMILLFYAVQQMPLADATVIMFR